MLASRPLERLSWQAFERLICRLLLVRGFDDVRLIGQSHDRGADVLAHRGGRRWLVQVKHWRNRAGVAVVDRTLDAMRTYRADVPVIAALGGFDDAVRKYQVDKQLEGISLQLWDRAVSSASYGKPPVEYLLTQWDLVLRDYQLEAVSAVTRSFEEGNARSGLVVLATGLGKTVVAAETCRRLHTTRPQTVIALAHTNDLVYQLERSFWPFLLGERTTTVWNGVEGADVRDVKAGSVVFSSVQTAAELARSDRLPEFDLILVDECHHVGGTTYAAVFDQSNAGRPGGPYLLGLTATPWRPDEVGARAVLRRTAGIYRSGHRPSPWLFGERGLSDVHRQHRLGLASACRRERSDAKAINRTLFIEEWDDAVVTELQQAWSEQPRARAIVFCGTVDHAVRMADRINALGFCSAAALHSNTAQHRLEPFERSLILSDFADNRVQVVCAVDIFNEGLDVPDVNILVFQRVTHSRRIFVQQLGRGLRIAEGKDHVVVLDFVSDIRRFAAGLDLKDQLAGRRAAPEHVRLRSAVEFRRVGGPDEKTESFLRAWLEDVAAIQDADETASVLKFPPSLS